MNTETPPAKIPFYKRHPKLIGAAILLLVFGLAGNWYIKQGTKKEPIQSASIIDSLLEETTLNEDGPVATVNGEEVSRLAYTNKLKEINAILTRQKINTANTKIAAEIRQQAIAELVNFRLLYQTATAAGHTASTEQVNETYREIVADMGDEETLALALGDNGLTIDDLKQQLYEQLTVDAYITATVDLASVTIDPAEVRAYYDTISTNNPDLPTYEDIRDRLTVELLQQKQQQLVTDLIQDLRADAEIEVLI